MKKIYEAFFADCDNQGGVYRYSLMEDGSLQLRSKLQLERPMYLELHGKNLYTIVRPEDTTKESGFLKVVLQDDGSMVREGEILSTLGFCACHLTVDATETDAYAVNYLSGSAVKFPDTLVTHQGKSLHPTRQEAAHAHQIIFTPDQKYLAVNDLGMDRIFLYDRDLNEVSVTKAPAGAGPRHTAFSLDGKLAYVLNELTSDVSVYRYEEGKLEYLASYSALPADFRGRNTAAAIRVAPDGKMLYTSNRGHDSIACFLIEGEGLKLLTTVPSGGAEPRDFNLTPDGKFLIATNQVGKNVTVFRMEEGIPVPTGEVVPMISPLAVVFGEVTE